MNELTKTLHGLADILDRMSIDYAVMDGFAVRAHGVPRPTYDIDLTITIERERLSELFDCLRDRNFEVPEAYESGWVDHVQKLPLVKMKRYVGSGSLDVDIFLAETEFLTEVMKRRARVDADGRQLWVISPEDLVLLKLLAGRPRDLGDITDIFFMQGKMNESYLRKWASELGIQPQLEKALAENVDDVT